MVICFALLRVVTANGGGEGDGGFALDGEDMAVGDRIKFGSKQSLIHHRLVQSPNRGRWCSGKFYRREDCCQQSVGRCDFWEACEVLDMLTPKLKDIAKAVSQYLVKPLLQMPRATLKSMRDNSGVVLKIVAQDMNGEDASVGNGVAGVQEKCANVIPRNLEAQLRIEFRRMLLHLRHIRRLDDCGHEPVEHVGCIGFSACSNSQLRWLSSSSASKFCYSLVFILAPKQRYRFVHRLHSKKRRQVILSNDRDLMHVGYHDSVKITGAAEKCSLNSSGESSKKGKVEKEAPVQIHRPSVPITMITKVAAFRSPITASMMLLGTVSSVLVRDYSNKTLPESVEEMRTGTHMKTSKV